MAAIDFAEARERAIERLEAKLLSAQTREEERRFVEGIETLMAYVPNVGSREELQKGGKK